VLGLGAGVVAASVAWVAASGGSPASRGGHAAKVTVTLPRTQALAAHLGPPQTLPWPSSGGAAVAIPSIGFAAQSGAEQSVPVASMTKIMTAYLVLKDHPLVPGEAGPSVTITATDAANFWTDSVTDQSTVELVAGEVLTEQQMLEGLLVHSANDLAFALARWDAGSVPAFVAKMNATAAALGMRATHYVDASGDDPGSQSTAADLLKVAAAAMADPAFAEIVDMTSVTLPEGGTVGSYTPLLGTPGVLGVKSGFTDAAGGGDVLAYRAAVGGRSFVVLAAVTSQEGPTVLARSGEEDLALAQAAAAGVSTATVAKAGTVVARLQRDGRTVLARTTEPATLLWLGGSPVRQSVRVRPPAHAAKRGTLVGTATFSVGTEAVSVPVRLAAALP
jgi:D-alanyl-D-alanine carboxypeptidase (penicillin-binding protein 5/6)